MATKLRHNEDAYWANEARARERTFIKRKALSRAQVWNAKTPKT